MRGRNSKARLKCGIFRKGASLAMVLVSMTILTIMGTLFTAIAMRSYEYSYAKLCKQQAYYTASSSIEAFYALATSESGVLSKLLESLNNEIEEKTAESPSGVIDPTTVAVKVGQTGGSDEDGVLISGGFFDTFLGDCELVVRYANSEKTKLSIEASATYNGYTETARALIAHTNRAASELKKIFDNTFCLQSPITTIVTEEILGDIYVSQPVAASFADSAGKTLDAIYVEAYNEVVEDLRRYGRYGNYEALPGQYLRDGRGNVITGTSNEARYNYVLKECVYGNVQASTADSSLKGHTKQLNFDNTPITDGYYNDWVELYLFSANKGDTTLNGNVYAHSRMLIGLLDKDEYNRNYIQIWNNDAVRYEYASSALNYYRTTAFDSYFSGSNLSPSFEHGFGESVFFDHTTNDVLDAAVAKFRINGNMYLWEDARIENFDSTQTSNAYNGIKNNIYAAKNLYIDGTNKTGWDYSWETVTNVMESTREVSIYGDIFVAGDAFISGANIYGDVYCYGNELTMVDTTVYGNVYFAGERFTGDRVTISSGTLSVSYGGKNATKNLDGGNLVIRGNGSTTNIKSYDEFREFGEADDVGGSSASYYWGAVLADCNVSGNLWSGVNTHILSWKSEISLSSDLSQYVTGSSSYGNIYVASYLFIDLIMMRDEKGVGGATLYSYRANWLSDVNDKYAYAARNNKISVGGMIYAERFQMRTNQSSVDNAAVSTLGNVCVGEGGLYIDGNINEKYTAKANIQLTGNLYSASNGKCWNTNKYDTDNFKKNVETSQIASMISSGYGSIEFAMQAKLNSILGKFALNPISQEETVFGNSTVWDGKVITLRTWSAPAQYDPNSTDSYARDPIKSVEYVGGAAGLKGTTGLDVIDVYLQHLKFDETAGSVSGVEGSGNYTLTIKQSVCFGDHADFSRFDRIIIDTTEANVHMKFLAGAEFGNPDASGYSSGSDIVLTGGNLTFWYLYQDGGYDFDSPTLVINPYTSVGLVQVSVENGNDGLYIISNDDSMIYMGIDASLNAFVYAPQGHFFIEPGGSGTLNTLNGCMAIESLILLTDGDVSEGGFFQDLSDAFMDLFGGKTGNDIIDATVEQYKNSTYEYVQPPLIVDIGLQYGDTIGEINDFSLAVWEFMGYY